MDLSILVISTSRYYSGFIVWHAGVLVPERSTPAVVGPDLGDERLLALLPV
jgi:hypothetical protein